MSETAATRTSEPSRTGGAEAVWARESALAVMSRLAGPLLGVGRLRLTGKGAERSALPRGTATDGW